MHWLKTIHDIRTLKQELARTLAPPAALQLPPAGTTAIGLAAVERRLGRRLPPTYRAFLELQDGWPGFFHGASLFGVRHLLRGAYVDVAGSAIAGMELIVFGIDAHAETIFAWNPASERPDGELEIVVWVNEIGERVDSFEAFLDLMHALLVAELDARAAPQTRRRPSVERRAGHRGREDASGQAAYMCG